MKPQHFFCYLAVIAVLFTACKKDKEKDYRAQWVGDWDFTSVYSFQCDAPPPWCDSYEIEYHYIGKIEFGGSDTTILVHHAEEKTVEIDVNFLGEIYVYDWWGSYRLGGNFIGETDVSFKYQTGHSPMFNAGWIITGKKIVK